MGTLALGQEAKDYLKRRLFGYLKTQGLAGSYFKELRRFEIADEEWKTWDLVLPSSNYSFVLLRYVRNRV